LVGLNYVAGLALAAFSFQSIHLDDRKQAKEHPPGDITLQKNAKIEEPPPPPPPPEVEFKPPVIEDIVEEENKDDPPPPDVSPPEPPPIADETVIEVQEEIVEFPDVEAEFPGGAGAMMKWINENVVYPQTSIEMNEQGRVFLSFVVEKNGKVSNVIIERGVSPDLDREARRVVRKMPRWIAGESAGRAVRARCRLPINFQLN
jgi:protein TonB